MRGLTAALMIALIAPAWGENEPPPPACDVPMPDFTLFDLQQRAVCLAEIEEPVIVVNFFAFWCDTWIAELPQLRELVTREQALGFRLISISVDGAWSNRLAEVCGEEPPAWPVLIDRRSRLSTALRLRHVPTILVLDQDRVIRHVFEGYPGNPKLLQAVREELSAN
jgi:peroxiredoxin